MRATPGSLRPGSSSWPKLEQIRRSHDRRCLSRHPPRLLGAAASGAAVASAYRVDDRRVISGILHVLRSGCRWRDCPPEYGPVTTIYSRWSAKGV
jgi:hypothetical protein